MLLTDDQRAALEEAVARDRVWAGDVHASAALAEVAGAASHGAVARWLLAADARLRARPCPHITGRTTQWCALGQTTAEADRALARIAAIWLREHVTRELDPRLVPLVQAATQNPNTVARARELAEEPTHGPN